MSKNSPNNFSIRRLLSGQQSGQQPVDDTPETPACCVCGSQDELLVDCGEVKCGSCFRGSLEQRYGYRSSKNVVRWHPQDRARRG